MRPDIRGLLSRLSSRDFQYRQFADPIADVEPWPLFAALLEDERVVGRAERTVEERAPAKNFLSDYDDMSARGDSGNRHGGSLRAFLSGLSDDNTERR